MIPTFMITPAFARRLVDVPVQAMPAAGEPTLPLKTGFF
jgi:hypothetical protein